MKEKNTIRRQREIYGSVDRFVARLLKERKNETGLYAIPDHMDHSFDLHFKPKDLIYAMDRMTHTKFKGNENVLGHLYMARHLLERARGYAPSHHIN